MSAGTWRQHRRAWKPLLACALLAILVGLAPRVHPHLAPQRATPDPSAAKAADQREADHLFAAGLIPRICIDLGASESQQLRDNPRSYVRARIREQIPGGPVREHPAAAVHLKGRAGSFRTIDSTPCLTVRMDEFTDEGRFHGLKKFHLNNSAQDPTYLCESLGAWAFAEAKVPTPRVSHARVWLNGRDLGLMVLKEGLDGRFLERHFGSNDGIVWEGNLQDIDSALPAKSPEGKPPVEGPELLAAASRQRDLVSRRQALDAILDVDEFLTFMAMESLLTHWDGYAGNRNNYRIYRPPAGRFVFLPHGMDQLLQRPAYPLLPDRSILGRALIESPAGRAAYIQRVTDLRGRVLDPPDRLIAELDRTSARLRPVLEEINPAAAQRHIALAAELRERIRERARNLDRLLVAMPRPLEFSAAGVAPLEGWLPVSDGEGAAAGPVEEQGRQLLRIRCENASGAASMRLTVLLARGRYRFEGKVRAVGVRCAPGPNVGAGLRIASARRPAGLSGDSGWHDLAFDFTVDEPASEVVLMCELRSATGQAFFDVDSLALRREVSPPASANP